MLKTEIPETELFDPKTNSFYTVKAQTLSLEHSLVSVSKWESKWHKSFLENLPKMDATETLYYIKCMTITQNVDPRVYLCLTHDNYEKIRAYINDPMTATTINEIDNSFSREIVTSELIYYWMTAFNIPFECQKWHFNRLITLIRVANAKNQPPKKMSRSEIMARNKALNMQRRMRSGSKG